MNYNEENLKTELTSLGSGNTKYPTEYSPEVLERFENRTPGSDDIVGLDCFEFSSLCLAGDTMIDVATDETKYPHGIPIQDLVGTEGYVFGVDETDLSPVCRKYHDVRKTQENVPVVKIIMEALRNDGSGNVKYETKTLTCTPNHLILIKKGFRDSEWIEAKNLQPGMRLIADQRSGDVIRSKPRHRLIGEAIFDEDILDIHHRDHNHYNNIPSNLLNMSTSDHLSYHKSVKYQYDDTLDIEELVALYNSGENFASIAKMYHCDSSTIESRIGDIVERRSQSESLQLHMDKLHEERDAEVCELYRKGYLIYEIAEYFQLHSTTISQILKKNSISIKESNYARYCRNQINLPALNHRVVKVIDAGTADVYNMEVEDVHNFFANGVIVHNCPLTHQPDIGVIHVCYIPDKWMVESKSMKLYLFGFRNHGAFHEWCVNTIQQDLVKLLQPKYLEVYGKFNSRGGISILPVSVYASEEFKEFKRTRQAQLMNLMASRHN